MYPSRSSNREYVYDDEYDGMYDDFQNEENYEDTCECDNDRREIVHVAGPIGPMGPMGPIGQRGVKGQQGPRGLQGPQGREGLQGLRGPQGNTGPQGTAGMQGNTGETGLQGIQGIPGATGATGAIGPQGAQGIQGIAGPAGENAAVIPFASASLVSYRDHSVGAQEALVFDISNIQSGFTVSEDYQSLTAAQHGTYLARFGALITSLPCVGDALALELNQSSVIEESRMPMLSDNSYVQGSVLLELNEGDRIRVVMDCEGAIEMKSLGNTVNSFLIIYQIS